MQDNFVFAIRLGKLFVEVNFEKYQNKYLFHLRICYFQKETYER